MTKNTKEKNKTIRRLTFSTLPVEALALQEYFEVMAQKGFMVTGRSGIFHSFERCEPRACRFQVDYFYKASIFDTHPERATEDYIDYCEAAGWHHCFDDGKMQCFYTDDPDVPPIETDNSFRFKSILRADLIQRSTMMFLAVLYIVMVILNMQRNLTYSWSWLWFITSQTSVSLVVFNSLFFLFAVISMLDLLYFYLINRRRLKEGKELHLYKISDVCLRRMCRKASILVLIIILVTGFSQDQLMVSIMVPFFSIMMVLFVAYDYLSRKNKLSRKDNIGISLGIGAGMTWVFIMVTVMGFMFNTAIKGGVDVDAEGHSIHFYNHDEIPITLKDLGCLPDDARLRYEETSFEIQTSVFASLTEFSNSYVVEGGFDPNPESGEMSPFYNVSVLESKHDWVTGQYVDNYRREEGIRPLSEESYSLLHGKGYQGYFKDGLERQYVLVDYGNRVVYVTCHAGMSEQALMKLLVAIE